MRILAESGPAGNTWGALEFLARIGPAFADELINLAAIPPDDEGERHFGTFFPKDEGALRRFIAEHIGSANLYWAPNSLKARPAKGKAKESDIGHVLTLHVDLDPETPESRDADMAAARARLEAFCLPPSFIIDSGRGLQAFWRLRDAVMLNGNLSDLKRYTERLASVLGADRTFNLDRLMRLPGTTNFPTKTKRRKGFTEARPTELSSWTEKTYVLSEFDILFELPEITNKKKTKARDESRSADLFRKVTAAVEAGYDDASIHAQYDSHPHATDQTDPARAVQRCIEKAREAAATERTSALEELNARYAVINWQGRTLVLSQPFDPVLNRRRIQLQTIGDFKNWMRNTQHVGKRTRADWWLDHPDRRQYKGIVFAPGQEHEGHLNLWRGWACEPAPGDCSEWLAMVRDVICSGDEALSNYVLDWCADAVQNPTERPGVTLVLLGKQGTGKGTFAQKTFGKLFGEHFLHIRHSRHLTGNFNAHLANGLLAFADEALYPGDKQGEGALKALITEPTIPIEFKGKDVVFVTNNIRVIMASNQSWVVPAAMDDRRFAVIQVSDAHAQDAAYFGRVIEANGDGSALLDYLMKRKLTVDLRKIPDTQARRDQIMMSMDPFDEFWFERLADHEGWEEKVRTDDVYEEYKKRAGKHPLHPTAFGIRLRSLFPEMRKVRPRGGAGDRPRYYYLPELSQAREQFQRFVRREWDWQDQAHHLIEDKEEPL